ncbi:MAG: OmpA family protein [Flavobacteriia bacterium]|jgi:outer membrane protein OmpA-like peptidoglycan-associated protein
MKLILLVILFAFNLTLFSQKTVKDSIYVFYFKSAQAKIPSDSLVKFQKFYKKYESCSSCIYELKGFADSVGNDAQNKVLSEKRIAYVKSLLKNTKITQIKEIPLGEKLSQKTKNNQDFRKVILRVKNPSLKNVTDLVQSEIKEVKKDTLTPVEKRKMEFSQRNKAIRLNILFYVNRIDLLPESRDDLEILAMYLQENPKVYARLEGHVCCNNDQELSRNRAMAIKIYLIQKGIKNYRLNAEGFGNTRPAVEEKNAADEQINRRVEVIFYEE